MPNSFQTNLMATTEDAVALLKRAWDEMVVECREVLGGELHYQAMMYHCLRNAGTPIRQLGMNVKQWVRLPITPEFLFAQKTKNEAYREGREVIPDIVMFQPSINGDWRRRNYENTLNQMLMAIEIKVSEREKGRLGQTEIFRDINKLTSFRQEINHRGTSVVPIMMVIDTARELRERMVDDSISKCRNHAKDQNVGWFYVSPTIQVSDLPSISTSTHT
ncbi:hypothetical protein [Thalassospira sp. MCCC 1A01428]|uniref:hypothetical protein n=1 Tax=Thalassospira sp. MCCC 1A01428 TaxID=1470575 RepID=UPI000A1DE5C5|nr:hypothetical protein [Thalassospira sp. MCCC 1A01428]OSQ42090.1 hypothetical protein THS27_15585 [Thalassospira sp. MCCC 1A01428]